MDLEGGETQAIIGAQSTIAKLKPKLAICIYHSNEDMLNLPLMIHAIVPDYKLLIRHRRCDCHLDTVLYATL